MSCVFFIFNIQCTASIDIAPIIISFTKAGNLANVNKFMDAIDPLNQVMKYTGKGVGVTFKLGDKSVKGAFVYSLEKLQFFSKYTLSIKFNNSNLYSGIPIPDVNVVKKADLEKKLNALTEAELNKLPRDENGIRLVEIDGEVITIGPEEAINKLTKALNTFLESIDPLILQKLKNVPGYDKVIADMQTYWTKFRGGKFQLEYAAKLIDDGKQIKLEVNNLSDNIKRIYDIEVTTFDNSGRRIIKKLELKNWNSFRSETIKNQFIKDLKKMGELGDIQWIFNKTSTIGDMQTLKSNVIKSLRKADGTPVNELKDISLMQAKKIFKDDLMNQNNYINRILVNLEKDDIFNQIFEIVN